MYRPGLARPVSSSGTWGSSPSCSIGSCSGSGEGDGDAAETSMGSMGTLGRASFAKEDDRTGSFEDAGLTGLTGDDSRSRSRYISMSAAVLLVVRFGGTNTG